MVWFWVGFNLFILAMLALDLGVFHRRTHEVKFKEALAWVGVWIGVAMAFNVGVYYWRGAETALAFFTGYIIEYSLSIDNIFVFILVFGYFKVPPRYQHRVLFWGILGALVLRASLILAGIALINLFHWILWVFGFVLIVSGIRMALEPNKEIEPGKNPVLRFIRRIMPVTSEYRGGKFMVREAGRVLATPLLVVLLFLEVTDLIFAFDSIPAILAISRDSFVVYTSNILAILGLRSLYFALSGLMRLFRYLPYGLAAVLVFVGVKLCLTDLVHIPVGTSLVVIAGFLLVAVIASLVLHVEKETTAPGS
jgi:tellurite resistance protein TerC